jgi:hypothetical protein
MSANIEFCPGRVHIFKQGKGTAGTGFYDLEPKVEAGGGGKVLVMGAPLTFREIVQPVVTLDDRRILFTFGSAWSEANVLLKVLLGDSNSAGAALGSVQQWYTANRLSKKKSEPCKISIATKGHWAYLVGMSVGQADPNYNTQDVTLTFMLSED